MAQHHATQAADPHSDTAAAPVPGRTARILNWRPGRLARVFIVLLLVLPITAGTVYVWALWDPSTKLREVPLAVVNNDAGVTRDGEQKNYGQEVADTLLNTDYLHFTQVDSAEADSGLLRGRYLFTVTIPEDFSEDTVTVIDPEPQQPSVTVSYNDYNGTNATILTSSLVAQIQSGVASALAENYASQVLDGLNQLGDGLRAASDGSIQLDDGAGQLKDGTEQAVDGVAQLDDGAAQLDDGAGQLKDGAVQLDDGMTQLLDGTDQLADGAGQIDEGVGQLTGLILPLVDTAGQLATAVRPVVGQLRSVGLTAEADELETSLSKLDAQSSDSTAGQLRRLKEGTAELYRQLSDPNAAYRSGILQLKDGTGQLRDGSLQLDDGAGQLKDGTAQLRDGLVSGSEQAPTVENVTLSAQQIAVPVAFESDFNHPVQTVVDAKDPTVKTMADGVSMLTIMVIGYMVMALITILAPYLVGKNTRHTRALGPVLKGFAALTATNAAALGVLALVSAPAGWAPQNLPLALLSLLLIAASGAAIFQFLRVLFGRVIGTVFSLGVYALGMFTFDGVWPLDTLPSFFAWFHPLHPMTYARYAFVRSTDNIIDTTFWVSIAALLGFTVVALLGSTLVRWLRVSGSVTEISELLEDRRRAEASGGGRAAAGLGPA